MYNGIVVQFYRIGIVPHMQTGFKGRVTCSLVCRAYRFFPVILGRRFVGEKRYPKRRIATPTIRLPVAVDLGYIERLHVTSSKADHIIAERLSARQIILQRI